MVWGVAVCTDVELEDLKAKEVAAGPVKLVEEGVVFLAHTSFPLP